MHMALAGSAAEQAPPPGSGGFRRTDAGNGEYFARLYGDRLRYDHRRGRWLVWADHWWRDDETRLVRRLAKEAARARYGQATIIADLRERADEARFAIGSENRQRIDAMLLAAQSEPPIADAGDRWDADTWLLGVANGVLDLRTGRLRPGSPQDRVTLHTDIAFDAAAACPRWERFLDEVFEGNEALVDYVKRAVGYSLTGRTSEQCLFVCHGTGANGKSVLLAILRLIAGEYGANTPFATLEAQARTSIPNDVAALAGRRLVTASETNDGVRLNEARLKALTGGDAMSARFLHGEFFTFTPVAKLWLAVNHRPRVGDDSEGFWRRMRLIPFGRAFTRDADPELADELRSELPGILAWAVAGALAWQAQGLQPPAAVTAATGSYRTESDPLAEFLEAACVTSETAQVAAASAYRAYRTWATEAGLRDRDVLSSRTFGERMVGRFTRVHTKTANLYRGVGLLAEGFDHTATTPEVKGRVKGPEHGTDQLRGSASRGDLIEEKAESPSTTRHPAPTPGSPTLPKDGLPSSRNDRSSEPTPTLWSVR